MPFGLRLRVLLPVALAIAWLMALHVVHFINQRHTYQQLRSLQNMQTTLDKAVSRLSDKHLRSMRRIEDALLDPLPENRLAILTFLNDSYLSEMEPLIAAVHGVIQPHGQDTYLSADLIRIEKQLQVVQTNIQEFVPALDILVEAFTSDNIESLELSERDLNRSDRNLFAALRTLDTMVRRTMLRHMQLAMTPLYALPPWIWGFSLTGCALALFFAFLPLQRLQRLLLSERIPADYQPVLYEEKKFVHTFQHLQNQYHTLERHFGERSAEVDHFQQLARRTEYDLLLLRLYNEHLVDNLRSAIVVTDGSLVIVDNNRTAKQLLGLSADYRGQSIESQPVFTALKTRLEHPKEALKDILAKAKTMRFENIAFANEHFLDISITPYQDESGHARGLLWVVDDVTETIRTKHQLLATERLAAVGRLSSQVAHEIRNPLSAIGLNAELLTEIIDGLPEPKYAEAKHLLHAIAEEIERLTEVTESYLHLARLPRPQIKSVDINQLVVDLSAMLAEEFRTNKIVVNLQLAEPSPLIHADPGQLRQALLNILRNSREAMPQGGKIYIATSTEDHKVLVSISDSGEGIPAPLKARIFEPFFSTKPEGTGLGLSLTQQIIQEHGGSIEVEEIFPQGAKFVLHLPQTNTT